MQQNFNYMFTICSIYVHYICHYEYVTLSADISALFSGSRATKSQLLVVVGAILIG